MVAKITAAITYLRFRSPPTSPSFARRQNEQQVRLDPVSPAENGAREQSQPRERQSPFRFIDDFSIHTRRADGIRQTRSEDNQIAFHMDYSPPIWVQK
jgi:hypothetical protein